MTDQTDFEVEVQAEIQTASDLGIHQALREFDASDLDSNTIKFPLPSDDKQTMEPVPEGGRIPRSGSDYERDTVVFDKYGFEVTDEADQDDIMDQVEMFHAAVASGAAREIYDNVQVTWQKNDNRLDLVRDAIVEAGSTVTYDDQDTVIVPAVLGEVIANDDPTRDWPEIADAIEDERSVQVVTDEYNVLRGADVLVVDADRFGYHATRTYPTTRSYTEYEEHDPARGINIPEEEREVQQEVVQAYVRTGYIVLNQDAGHVVRFGQV